MFLLLASKNFNQDLKCKGKNSMQKIMRCLACTEKKKKNKKYLVAGGRSKLMVQE
jgi:uncharacterized protein (DUF1499 family)